MGAATGLALVSLASNVTTAGQLQGEADTFLAVRKTVSMLMNAGTLWAGLAVLSGWVVRRPVQAAAAGVVALLAGLVVHYGLGLALGMFDAEVGRANSHWFLFAVVLGGPLGLVGAVARRPDLRGGVAARMAVPAAALLEPFIIGTFTRPAFVPWPSRVASVATGLILLTAGTAGCIGVLVAARKQRSQSKQRTTASA